MTKILNSVSGGGETKAWRIFSVIVILALIATMINLGSEYNKSADWLAAKTGNKIKLPHTKEIPYRLGLDLLGGTQLTYQVDVSTVKDNEKSSAVEGVRDVIERRVNAFGVAEPNIQTNLSNGNYYVLAELAGIKDTAQAIKMIGETPLLEFKEQNQSKRELTKEEKDQLDKSNKAAEKIAKEVEGKLAAKGDFAALAAQYSQDEATKTKGGSLDYITESANPIVFDIAHKLKVGETSKLVKTVNGYEFVKLEDKRVKTDPFSKQPELEVRARHLLVCFKDAQSCTSGFSKEEAKAKADKLKTEINAKNFADLVKINSTEPGAKDSGGELGWFGRGKMVKAFDEAVFAGKKGEILGPVETEFGYHLIWVEDQRQINEYKVSHIFIKTMSAKDIVGDQGEWQNTELTGKNLKRSVVTFNPNDGSPEVSLEFDEQGADMFSKITERNIGKQVAIFLDGYAISSPKVNEKIPNGKAVINGTFDIAEAKLLAQRLNAGALPVPINLVNQQTVGATLGQQSVDDSVKAGLIGFALVAIFMVIVYRLPGLLAVLALLVYAAFSMSIFKLGSFTLTLSGLAGFIMSIGVAVDANILVFARLREELVKGKPLGLALEEGFKRAWPSIRDSNMMTILTCVILISTSTGSVKGFAVTLLLGVLVSMFTAIFVTRTFLKLLPERWLEKNNWLIGRIKN